MAEPLSLMEFLQALLRDAELRGSFGADAQGTLDGHGLSDLTPADVHDALVLVQDNETVDFHPDLAIAPALPPPPAGDGHEAAVEYLSRYLAGPEPGPADDPWVDTDPDAAFAPAAAAEPAPQPDPIDHGYGAGAPDTVPSWPGGADDPTPLDFDTEPYPDDVVAHHGMPAADELPGSELPGSDDGLDGGFDGYLDPDDVLPDAPDDAPGDGSATGF